MTALYNEFSISSLAVDKVDQATIKHFQFIRLKVIPLIFTVRGRGLVGIITEELADALR